MWSVTQKDITAVEIFTFLWAVCVTVDQSGWKCQIFWKSVWFISKKKINNIRPKFTLSTHHSRRRHAKFQWFREKKFSDCFPDFQNDFSRRSEGVGSSCFYTITILKSIFGIWDLLNAIGSIKFVNINGIIVQCHVVSRIWRFSPADRC